MFAIAFVLKTSKTQILMASQNYLYRGGEKIPVAKEPAFFTTIVPNERVLQELEHLEPVEEMQQVFDQVYKIRTAEETQEDVMRYVRSNERMRGVCHHAYHPVGDAATRYYLTDQLVVAFQTGTSESKIESILEQHGLRFLQFFGEPEDLVCLIQVTSSAGKNPIKVSEDLAERPEVLYAEPNLINRFQSFYFPEDDLFKRQWHLTSMRGIELLPDAHIDATGAWTMTRGSREVVVAVIDDGFDLTHPDLKGTDKVVFPRDFLDNDDDPSPNFSRGDFHGTPCAGIAIGEENGTGIVGVAPGCRFMPIRFGMAGDDRLLYNIFDFVGKRADVISNSWGPVPVFAPLPSLVRDQITELVRTGGPRGKGCVIVFAAGNYNAPIYATGVTRFTWRHPVAGLRETQGTILNGFAAHPDVITVSASTSQNRKAAYSNWGKEIALCAPSDNGHPLDPRLRQPGQGIWTATNFRSGSRYTGTFGGTSAACPMVAGVAALIRSVYPEATALEVREILISTADKIVDTNPDPVLNLRKGNYDDQGHSEWFGYGKVNAYQAVRRALELKKAREAETPQPAEEILKEGIYIAAAMINPEGPDRGNEMVALLNTTDRPVDVTGWEIRNRRGESERIPALTIQPGFTNIVFLQRLQLPNTGGSIALYNPNGDKVHEVNYTFAQGMRAGWWVRF